MNEIIINLDVRDKKYFVSKYNDDVIDQELSAYIYSYMVGKNTKDKVKIMIDSKLSFSTEEQEKYSNILMNDFNENIIEIEDEIRKSNIKKAVLFFLGVAFISISYFASSIDILSQVLTVFGWVALWEVANSIMFGDASLKKSLARYKQLSKSEIIFTK